MKPVMQTKFTKDDGNCLQACMASILELPIESVPDFVNTCGQKWLPEIIHWCHENGFGVVFANANADHVFPQMFLGNIYGIASFSIPGHEYNHAVVVQFSLSGVTHREHESDLMHKMDIVHDPWPYPHRLGDLENVMVLVPTAVACASGY